MLSRVQLFATPWTVAHQAPLSMGILQAGILEWVACPPPGDLISRGIKPGSPALQMDSPPAVTWEALYWPRGLSSKRRNVSNGRHKGDSIGLEVKAATWPFWAPHASESTGKEGNTVLARVIDPNHQKVWCYSTIKVRKSISISISMLSHSIMSNSSLPRGL